MKIWIHRSGVNSFQKHKYKAALMIAYDVRDCLDAVDCDFSSRDDLQMRLSNETKQNQTF